MRQVVGPALRTKPEGGGASVSDQLDPKTFDLDEWLAGASRVTKFVEVYGKPHLRPRSTNWKRSRPMPMRPTATRISGPTSCETRWSQPGAIQGRVDPG